MSFKCYGTFRIPVSKDDRLVVFATIQAFGLQKVTVKGPGVDFSYAGESAPSLLSHMSQAFDIAKDGELDVAFDSSHPVAVLPASCVCKFGKETFVETFVLATDLEGGPNPDGDFNDLVVTLQVTRRRG